MAYRSLAISMFILLFFFSVGVVNSLNNDLYAVNPSNAILGSRTPPRWINDTGIDDSLLQNSSVFTDIKQTELNKQSASEFSKISITQLVYSSLVNSSYGFKSAMLTILQLNDDGSAAANFLEILQWLIVLNHCFAIFQLLFRDLGWGI